MSGKRAIAKVNVDITRNRLLLEIGGRVTRKDLESLYTDIRFCVADLQPGFDVISNLTNCTIGNLDCIPTFRRIMHFLIEKKVAEVIRITRGKSLIHRQIVNFTARRQGYVPVYVSSMKEAEEYLNSPDRKNNARINLQTIVVHYSSTGGDGKGYLYELSTECCSVKNVTFMPELETEISLNFQLQADASKSENFSLKANITSVEDEMFLCQFIDLGIEDQEKLWKCLVHEATREV